MWSDNETTEDLLGFQTYADLIYETISDPNILPLTIGVFADWGGGKSSVLRMLQQKINLLGAPQKQFCIYVNTWTLEGYDDAKAAIIDSVLHQIKEHPTLKNYVKDNIGKIVSSVKYMRLLRLLGSSMAITALFNGQVEAAASIQTLGSLLPDSKDKEENIDKDVMVLVREFRDNFSDLLRTSEIETLVIIVDDLDRCAPTHIIENLEAIKLFLNVKKTAFVIGSDPRLVNHAIRVHYRGLTGGSGVEFENESQIAKDYLEKIIHIPFYLPRLSVSEVQSYMSMLFCKYEIRNVDAYARCLTALREHIECDRYSPLPSNAILAYVENAKPTDDIIKRLEQSLAFCETAATLIVEGLKGNPRLIKRFMNTYVLRSRMATVAHLNSFEPAILVKLMVLEYGDSDEYRKLYDFVVSGKGYPTELAMLEDFICCDSLNGDTNENSLKWKGSDFVKRWIVMFPKLSGIDLRDYFWLSRDTLENDYFKLAVLSPNIKNIVDALSSDVEPKRHKAARELLEYQEAEEKLVLDELGRRYLANPSNNSICYGFHSCILNKVPNAASKLSFALNAINLKKVTPAQAMRFADLLQKHPIPTELKISLEKISISETIVGKALKQQLQSKRN